MYRLEFWEVPEDYVVDFAGSSDVDFPIGKKPIGTCDNISEERTCCIWVHSHPIGFLGKRLDHQTLILLSPFAHPRVQVDHRDNIIDDVPLLSSFVVK
jgi:hypothetical protein